MDIGGNLILKKAKLWTLIAHDRIMLEQKFHFLVKDLSLNYHLGKEKYKKSFEIVWDMTFQSWGCFPDFAKIAVT